MKILWETDEFAHYYNIFMHFAQPSKIFKVQISALNRLNLYHTWQYLPFITEQGIAFVVHTAPHHRHPGFPLLPTRLHWDQLDRNLIITQSDDPLASHILSLVKSESFINYLSQLFDVGSIDWSLLRHWQMEFYYQVTTMLLILINRHAQLSNHFLGPVSYNLVLGTFNGVDLIIEVVEIEDCSSNTLYQRDVLFQQ